MLHVICVLTKHLVYDYEKSPKNFIEMACLLTFRMITAFWPAVLR